jgi:pseudaminic acid biosynthesis-associated methylase
MTANQEQEWCGKIGADYTDRSMLSAEELDSLYLRLLGITRADLNQQFLEHLPRSLQILEVGCNIGMQLRHLQNLGFWNLQGIELQQYALNRLCVERVETRQGSATDLPYPDKSFDLVFTSGVLIHIHPYYLGRVMSEIKRCTRRYIWGFEYFSETLQEVTWRKWEDMLWSADYAALFLNQFPGLTLLNKWSAPYSGSSQGLVASMYLLEKESE